MKNISNMSPLVCYCGEKGEDTLNVLKCIKCGRWCHEDCTKCLDLPMLLGDKFYLFICAVCNNGTESLSRMELRWLDIAHLLLYHLTMLEKKKYFHIETLVPYLHNNWDRFHIFGPVASQKKNIRPKLQQNLENCHNRFKCGKEVKKCKDIWALRERIPPEPPKILQSGMPMQEDALDFNIKGTSYHIITVKNSRSPKNKEGYRNGKSKLPFSSTRLKNGVSKCRGSISHFENGNHRTKHKNKRPTTTFDEHSAQFGLLDTIIPSSNFENVNNLFEITTDKSKWRQSSYDSSKAIKRKRDSENTVDPSITNGNYQFSDENSSVEPSFIFTKETDFRKSNVDFCIIGKRTTYTGKVQYLFQRNRAKMEKAVAEKKPLFQITYLCKCRDCKRKSKLAFLACLPSKQMAISRVQRTPKKAIHQNGQCNGGYYII